MKRSPFSVMIRVAVLFAAVPVVAGVVLGCGDTGGGTTVPSLATTSVSLMEDGPPTTAATVASSASSALSASSTAAPGAQTSMSQPEDQTTTVTTVTATSTGSTLAEPPTSDSVSQPSGPSSTLIVKPTNLPLRPVNTWRLYQETDPFLYWDGPWVQYSHPAASGSGYKSALTNGRAALTFTGRRISLLCATGPKSGKIRITLDYEVVATVDLYANPYWFPGVVWTSAALPNGAHVLQIAPAGTKNPRSAGYAWDFDAVKIFGKLLEYTQD